MVYMLVMGEERKRQKFERDYRANTRALRRLRAKAKLSLKGLEDKSGISYTTISRIENGHNRSSHWYTLEQLATALGVDVEAIVIFDDDEPQLPGNAKTEEHLDAVLDHEEELRQRRDAKKSNGEGNESGGSKT